MVLKKRSTVPARIQTLDHPDHSKSLYRLYYLGFIYHTSISHTTCTISDFSLFSSRLFKFASLRRRFSSFTFFLSSTKARECSLTCFSSSLTASFFSFDLLIPGVLIIDENLLRRKEQYSTIIILERTSFITCLHLIPLKARNHCMYYTKIHFMHSCKCGLICVGLIRLLRSGSKTNTSMSASNK